MIQIVIPARYESVRLPGKPLIKLAGKEMLLHVYEKALDVYQNWNSDVKMLAPIVATDSSKIVNFCENHNISNILTPSANTGTDRVFMCARESEAEFFVNLQGDEPVIPSKFLKFFCEEVVKCVNNTKILNAVCPLSANRALDENNVKAILVNNNLICFLTRLPEPAFFHNSRPGYYKQVGLYGFNRHSIKEFCELPPSNLEQISNIELMRWIDFGYKIEALQCDQPTYSVDIVEDAIVVERILELSQSQSLT